MYLKHVVRIGPAKHVVEGLPGSDDQYKEAVDCMYKHTIDLACSTGFMSGQFLMHHHSRTVVARNCTNCMTLTYQHLCAPKAMDYELSGHICCLPTR